MQPLPWETTSLVFLWVCMCGPQRTFLPRNTAGNRETHLLCLMGGGPETWSWLVLPKALGRTQWEDYHLPHPAPASCVHRPFLLHWAMLVTGVGPALMFIDYAVRQGCKKPMVSSLRRHRGKHTEETSSAHLTM